MELMDLRPRRGGRQTRYRPKSKPKVSHALMTASFRFGHAMIPDQFYGDIEPNEPMSPNDYTQAHHKFRT